VVVDFKTNVVKWKYFCPGSHRDLSLFIVYGVQY
jgi:hypothetical protein